MAEKKLLLSVRKQAKKIKPSFIVKEAKFTSGIKKRWRFPRGKHSKIRQYHVGKPALPTPGYSSPKAVRGLHSSGMKFVVVANLRDLQKLNKETEGAIISSTVGKRKKLDLLKFISENGIKVLNVRDTKKLAEQISIMLEARKSAKKIKVETKDQKKQEKEKKAEEKKQKEEMKKKENSVEDVVKKEESQKKEMEKTLTKKQ
jgi:large subunit ribosomal protein L32e